MNTFFKNFLDWFDLKPKLEKQQKRPLFQEREVWNCHWGCNVGFELDGKHNEYIRPVLVLKKMTHNTFLGIPLTTKQKNGNWYIKSTVQNREGRYIIAQIRVIDSKRLSNKIEQVPKKEFFMVKEGFLKFMKT